MGPKFGGGQCAGGMARSLGHRATRHEDHGRARVDGKAVPCRSIQLLYVRVAVLAAPTVWSAKRGRTKSQHILRTIYHTAYDGRRQVHFVVSENS